MTKQSKDSSMTQKRKGGRTEESDGREVSHKEMPSEHDRTTTYMNSQHLWLPASDPYMISPVYSSA